MNCKNTACLQLISAPLAAVFLILSLCAFVMQRSVSAGIPVTVSPVPTCGVDRVVIVDLMQNGNTKINERKIQFSSLATIMAEIMGNRAERATYVAADPEISYQRFMSALDAMRGTTKDLEFILLSAQTQEELCIGRAAMDRCKIVDLTPHSRP